MTKEALLKMIDGTMAERKFLAENSFGLFCIYYFKEYFTYSLAPYHYDFFNDCHELVDNKIKEVAWIGYRECGKTSVAKLFVIWLIVNNKRKYINVDSFDKENAERILFDVAFEMSNNKRLQADFGVLFSKERSINDIKQNRINNFVCENGTRVEAHSTQESVRGRLHLNQRPDALIFDDIETNKTKDSQAYTKQVADHLSEAMAGMSVDGFILYLGNYITEYGNIANIFKRAESDKNIRVRNIPIIIDGKPAWESKYCLTDAEIETTGKVSIESKQRQLGSQVFSYEMMNTPIDDSIAEFKKEWLQYAKIDDIRHLQYNTFISIDTAVSQKDSADFTGITVNRVTTENKWYITAYKMKINPAELIDHIFYLYDTYKPTVLGIEETVFSMAIQPFLEEEMRKRNKFISITPLKHGGIKKETRIRGLIPRFESKSIFLVGDCSALEQDMRVFPRGQHDDCIAEGSLILTDKGQVPIENIKVGDFVMTMGGFQEVLKVWDKGLLPVITNLITGTPDHRVITTTGEKVLCKLGVSDILYVWNNQTQSIEKQSYTMVKDFIDTQTQSGDNIEYIIGNTTQTTKAQYPYIDRFGLTTLEKYLKDFIYTTKMKIHSIMKYITWKLSQLQITLNITQTNQNELLLQETMLLGEMMNFNNNQEIGEKPNKVLNGIKNTQKIHSINQSQLNVQNVEQKQLDMQLHQSIVPINVKTKSNSETLNLNTQIIEKRVYDLMVNNHHEFFVDSILVHNCIDSLAMQEQIAFQPHKQDDMSDIFDDTPLYNSIGL